MSARLARLGAPAAFVLIATLAWGWAYAPYGFSGLDEGFVTAASWRVVQGQLPYRDFVWVRPPGSLLIHAVPLLLLPERLVVIAERFALFGIVAAYSLVAASLLERKFDLARSGLSRWLLATCGVACSLQGFPPMAWHTVDGILLGTLGLGAVCCAAGPVGLASGVLLLCAAAACKQSFLFLPPLALAWIGAVRGRGAFGVAFGVASACVAAALAAGAALGVLADAAGQIASASSVRSLLYAGVVAYGPRPAALALLVAAGCGAAWLVRGRGGLRAAPYVLFGACYCAAIAHPLLRRSFQPPPFNYPGLLLVLAFAEALRGAWRATDDGRRQAIDRYGTLALLLALAWCASLSWGYPTPVLFALPAVFGVVHAARNTLGVRSRALTITVTCLALAAQAANYRFPYREAPRAELDRELGVVFPKLSHVRGSRASHDRHSELRALVERHEGPWVVLPGLPLAGFLTGTVTPLRVDWARNAETGGATALLLDELERSRPLVLVERTLERRCRIGPACSELAWEVAEKWSLLERTRFFDVYRHPGESGADEVSSSVRKRPFRPYDNRRRGATRAGGTNP